MRAYDGQFSDNRPIRRSRDEKRRQLADLKQTLAGMKAHTSPALRSSISAKIAELEAELGSESAGGGGAGGPSGGGNRRR